MVAKAELVLHVLDATEPLSVEDEQFLAEFAGKQGIFFRPGERFMGEGDGRQYVRLAYSHVTEPVITAGIERLGAILRECARR